jgi:glycosyltransferase involved in cell wall biosynthesis
VIRVAITVEQSWSKVPGGTARVTNELIRAIEARIDLSFDLVGVSAWHRHRPPAAWTPSIPIERLPLPTLPLFESWHRLRRPRVEWATGPVDVVHGTIIAVPASLAPLVLTIHDLAFLTYPEHFSRRGLSFFRRALDLARRHARLVTCPSEATMEECRRAGFDERRLRLVPWGVRAAPASEADVEASRRRHGLVRPYVLFCGTIEPRKNLPRVIEGFRRADVPGLDLVLAGPQGWNEDIGRLLDPLDGRAHALGFVPGDELGPLYAGAAAVVYPSLREGFGLPVLEAMAQGAPVITSLGTATEEVAGDAALLVDPHDSRAIAEAIAALMRDRELASRFADAGRARAATYSWDRTAERMAAVYAEAARR